MVVGPEGGGRHEILVPADPGDLATVDAVRHHLAVEVEAQRAVDGDQLLVVGDQVRVVDHLDGQEGDIGVVVQPLVEVGGTEGEGGDRHPVEDPLVGVGHLARQMQAHHAVGEHLAVDPIAPAGPGGQLVGHDVGDRADPDLEGGPVGDEAHGHVGDGVVDLVGGGVGQRIGLGVRLDQDVDQVHRQGVGVLGREGAGAGKVGAHLDHQHPVGVLARQHQLVIGAPEVEGEVDVAVGIGRGAGRGHDPGREAAEDRGELPESSRHQLDVVALAQQHPLRRPEEPAAVGHLGMGEHRVVPEQQGAPDHQPLPVVPRPEGGEQGVGVGRAEAEGQGVPGLHQGGGFGGRADSGRHRSSVCHRVSDRRSPGGETQGLSRPAGRRTQGAG